MNEIILKTSNLTKTYRNINAVDNVNMTIRKGQIYGLIGLNAAGKTTLIRLVAGLALRTRGGIELFGETHDRKIQGVRRRMGCLIDAPAFYQFETAYENMEIMRIQKGIPGKECIERALKTVGLADTGKKKVMNFSLGMKQRLGIAMALIGDPEFLVLDEPINGLDPMGIIEIRELLKKINEEYGVTILISSHILAELYQLANCYGIIHKGRLIQEITSKELNERCKKLLHIKVDDAAKAAVIINKKLSTTNFEVLPGNVIKLYDYIDNSGKVSSTLNTEGVLVEQIMPMGDDLETYFTKVIGGSRND